MSNSTTYYIFISSSSDLKTEREVAKHSIEEFSQRVSKKYLIELKPFMHEHDVGGRLEPGKTPQQIIDEDLRRFESGQHRGVYMGMVWKRYGIPVAENDPRSGTEYELAWALERMKQGELVSVKFFVKIVDSEEPVDVEQYNRVQIFIRDKLQGLYKQIGSSDDLANRLNDELTLTLNKQLVPDNINRNTRELATKIMSAHDFFEAKPSGENSVSYLDQARLALAKTSGQKYLIIQGMAGVGKSYLAARLLADYYPSGPSTPNPPTGGFEPAWIWWVDADTHNDPQKVENQLLELARYLGITSTKVDQALAELSEKLSADDYAWLLVFDNALDSGTTEELQRFRDAYFPKTSATKRIIITSQNTNWQKVLQNKKYMELDVWSVDEFAAFFAESSSIAIDTKTDRDFIETLHDTFKGLPIAAGLARSYMEQQSGPSKRYPFRNYVDLIADEGEQMSQYTEQLDGKREENLILALTLTYRLIQDSATKTLFQTLCCFAPEDIPVRDIQSKFISRKGQSVNDLTDFLPLLADTRRMSGALTTLRNYSLLSTDGKNYMYHRLIKSCLRFYLQEVEETDLPYRQAEQISALVFDYPNIIPPKEQIGFYDLMSTHIAEISAHTPDVPGDVVQVTLHQRRALYLFHKGRNPEAYDLLKRADTLLQNTSSLSLYWRIYRLKAYLEHLENKATEKHIEGLQEASIYFNGLLKAVADPLVKAEIREDLNQTNSYIGILSERWGHWNTAEDAYRNNFKLAQEANQERSPNESEQKHKQEEFNKEEFMFHHHMGRLTWYERDYNESIRAFEKSIRSQKKGTGRALTQMIYGAALGQFNRHEDAQRELNEVFEVISTSDEFRRITYTAFYLISFAWDYNLPDFDLSQYLPYIETKTIKVYDPMLKSRVDKAIADVNVNDLKHQHIIRNIRLRRAVREGNRREAEEAYEHLARQKLAIYSLDDLVQLFYEGRNDEIKRFNDEGTLTESALIDYAKFLVALSESTKEASLLEKARKVTEQAFAITSYFVCHRDAELEELTRKLNLNMQKFR